MIIEIGLILLSEGMHYFRFSNAPNKEMLYQTTDGVSIKGSDFIKKDQVDVELCDALRKPKPGHQLKLAKTPSKIRASVCESDVIVMI